MWAAWALINPPQVFSRGKRARSTRRTRQERAARMAAQTAPAGPAPTTTTSNIFSERRPSRATTEDRELFSEFSITELIIKPIQLEIRFYFRCHTKSIRQGRQRRTEAPSRAAAEASW